MESFKILVCGDVGGSFNQLFKRLEAIEKSNGPFKMLFCVGSFFEPYIAHPKDIDIQSITFPKELESYRDEKEQTPIPIYFISSTTNDYKYIENFCDSKTGQLCKDIYYLGKTGLKCFDGLNVAYLSGRVDFPISTESLDSSKMIITIHDQNELYSQCSSQKRIDILLTNQWPRHMLNNVDELPNIKNPLKKGLDSIKDICIQLKPAYHFSKDYFYYQRKPYLNASDETKVTRFLSLAPVYNDKKEKYLFAMNYQPNKEINLEDSTPNPFELQQQQKKQRIINNQQDQFIQTNFFFQSQPQQNHQNRFNNNNNNNNNNNVNRKRKMEKEMDVNCWFCLSSPNVESHLISTVGNESYLAFPKGQMVDGHVLIVFIEHKPSLMSLGTSEREDIDKFLNSLTKYFDSLDQDMVVFERNVPLKGTVNHGHLQIVPIPRNKNITVDQLKQLFIASGKDIGIDFKESSKDTSLDSLKDEILDNPYFLLILQDGSKLFSTLSTDQKSFDYQFGRKLMCQLLDCPEKLNWKDCLLSKEMEENQTIHFRDKFKSFYD
ncbi:cwfJ family protein [Tieghemostelium lacteum]|uniref:CwfJ family protein n=1 Tax=Tieghemostelium lacteum TaxID=361077 RepID=A0A152A8M2_TIELA|nr:cwfJ family protein [Tieghemostelium lacteum]|eukprot:KYR02544.1 cwfJ family protein [Tieghemostelium lacteum]